ILMLGAIAFCSSERIHRIREPDVKLYNAYFAFRIQDPKIAEHLAAFHEAALNVSSEFVTIPADKLQLPLVDFH
ncbi:hypothetical protein PENTCL1PPCAC_12126, partial [Pristionchus entomophagus]